MNTPPPTSQQTKPENIMQIKYTAALEAIKAAFPRASEHGQRFLAACAIEVSERGGSVDAFIDDVKARKVKAKSEDLALRAALREQFGRYRITATDEVHVYGVMPNTNQVGWWRYGDREEAAERLGLNQLVIA